MLKELEPENWVHNGGTDFAVQLKPPSASDVLGKVLTAEGTYTHWSLFNRFILANEILDAADSAGKQWCNRVCTVTQQPACQITPLAALATLPKLH